jgi:hydrogenase 3 maturation protease
MTDLYGYLKERLHNAERLAILGAGSLLMGDDAAGVMVVEKLRNAIDPQKYPLLRLYNGGTAPENFSGEIKRFNPSHLMILDAADLGEEVGSVMTIQPDIIGGVSFSTHMLPLKVMTNYIEKEIGCDIVILGIQPKEVSYGEEMTPEIKKAVDETADILEKVIREITLSR